MRDGCPAGADVEAGERQSEIREVPATIRIDMMRCIYCGFCVDARPKKDRHEPRAPSNGLQSGKWIYSIEKTMQSPVLMPGSGHRPNRPFAEAKLSIRRKDACAYPSVTEERHPAVL
jgi:ferredoxin